MQRHNAGGNVNQQLNALQREVGKQEQQINNLTSWLENHQEGVDRKFAELNTALGNLSNQISQQGNMAAAPLWKFATVLLGIGGVAVSVLMGVGSLVYSFTNHRVTSLESTERFFQQELVKSVEQRSRLDEKAQTAVSSLETMDAVLQREMNLKDDNLRREILGRLDGVRAQIELVNERARDLEISAHNPKVVDGRQ